MDLSNRSEFDMFLMLDLKDIKEELPDPSIRAYALLTTLAAGGDELQESMFRAYIAEADIPEDLLVDYLAYFAGMKLFYVVCDCIYPETCDIIAVMQNQWFVKGRSEWTKQSSLYEKSKQDIKELKESLEI
jgi:hypothetical protein